MSFSESVWDALGAGDGGEPMQVPISYEDLAMFVALRQMLIDEPERDGNLTDVEMEQALEAAYLALGQLGVFAWSNPTVLRFMCYHLEHAHNAPADLVPNVLRHIMYERNVRGRSTATLTGWVAVLNAWFLENGRAPLIAQLPELRQTLRLWSREAPQVHIHIHIDIHTHTHIHIHTHTFLSFQWYICIIPLPNCIIPVVHFYHSTDQLHHSSGTFPSFH
jgi:hypothetical protein